MSEFVPAEMFPVWEYISDEIDARGWSIHDLALRMPGDVAVNLLSLELLKAEADSPLSILGEMTLGEEIANGLAKAFGSSAEIWMRLDRSFKLARAAHIQRHGTGVGQEVEAG